MKLDSKIKNDSLESDCHVRNARAKSSKSKRMNTRFLQNIDHYLGPIACFAGRLFKKYFPCLESGEGQFVKRILIIKFWGIGSITQLCPSLRYLRDQHPKAEIHFLTLTPQAAIVECIEEVNVIHSLSIGNSIARFLVSILPLMKRLRDLHFDTVYDFEFFANFSALCCAAVGVRSIGFKSLRAWRNAIYDVTPSLDVSLHIRQQFLKLASAREGQLPASAYSELIPFTISGEVKKSTAALLAKAGINGPFIAVNPNAGDLFLGRRWPAARFSRLSRQLAEETNLPIVLIGSREEREYVLQVKEEARHMSVFSLAGQMSLIELIALLSKAHLYVGNDSGPLHLAVAQGTKTVSLFGPESCNVYGPCSARHEVITLNLWCSPCINVYNSKRMACHDNACIKGISVDCVHERCLKLLDGCGTGQVAKEKE
ncbi:glycosyltransferase family 9 protein [Desulfobacter vibrioformis]|uniref:glycosyltransferase family 9 protein n=1 Tax=Desulfobacter vibrioformis TaxID=34031 RepID=UPI00054DF8BE|nr:glycosyltransferase family 9 protein [Desulfobacter vibrioformis]